MNNINWPDGFLPGKTDFYVANETIKSDVDTSTVWQHLIDITLWPTAYSILNNVVIHSSESTRLQNGDLFEFQVGDTLVNAEVVEYDDTVDGVYRLAWHGQVKDNDVVVVDAHCAFLIELLSENRTRVVMQESLKGEPAKQLSSMTPNPALQSNQNWVNGLANTGLKK